LQRPHLVGTCPVRLLGESLRGPSRPRGRGEQPPKRTSEYPRSRWGHWAAMPDGRQPLAEPGGFSPAPEDVAFRKVQTVRSKCGLPGPGKSPWLLGLRGSGVLSLLRHQQLAIENWSGGYRSELRCNREAHAGCSEKAGKGLGRSWLPPGYTHVRLDEAKIAFTMTRKRGFCGLTRSTAPSRPANQSQRVCRRAWFLGAQASPTTRHGLVVTALRPPPLPSSRPSSQEGYRKGPWTLMRL